MREASGGHGHALFPAVQARHPVHRRCAGCCAGCWLVLMLVLGTALLGGAGAGESPSGSFGFGYSSSMFTDVNKNDALAAVKVWLKATARKCNMDIDINAKIFNNVQDMATALRNKTIDGVSITTIEYLALKDLLDKDRFILGVRSGSITEEYLVLVRNESPVKGIEELFGKRIGVFQNSRTSLAQVWLDVALAREGKPRSAEFFKEMTGSTKMDKLVYEVFFSQSEACLVTRSGFDVLTELNPQIGEQLKVLAESPPVVPVLGCFAPDNANPFVQLFFEELSAGKERPDRWHQSPGFRQIMVLFYTDRVALHPGSCLDTTLDLLAAHKQFFPNAWIHSQCKIPGSPGI